MATTGATTDTHCPYCSLQCGMRLVVPAGHGGGALPLVVERPDFPVNRGALCGKGQSAAALLSPAARLTTPLLRDRVDGRPHGGLRAASWDEALDRVARGFAAIRSAHGADAVGVFGGGGLTNEKAYQLGKFARVALGTATIDYNGRFCMSSAAAGNRAAFGLDRGLPFPLEDIPRTECLILVGGNPAETMPPALRYFRELRQNGGTLIVVDPRRTRTAEQADLHLRPLPGSDLALALGLLHLLIADRMVDTAFVAARTTGFEEARAAAMAHWPERVERLTGVPVSQLREVAAAFGRARTGMVLTARGPEQQSKGTDTVKAWINLCLAAGKAGRPYSGYGCLTGQGNGQGGREHGQKADQLPGYRSIEDPAAREHVAKVWGVDAATLPGAGRSAYELLDSLGRPGPEGVRGLLVMGSNPVVSAPRAAHVTERLRALDLLVVSELALSETAQLADVVLPSTQWAEETGTMTNLEGRVILRGRAVDAPEGVRSDLWLMRELAARLGVDRGFDDDPETVFDELRRASAGGPADYSGITYERIRAEDGVFWPCPATDHPGTPRLFLDAFATPDGRARFSAVTHRPAAEEPDTDYPLHLTTGRVLSQYQSGTQTRRIGALNSAAPGPFVELHPLLAGRLGVGEGELLAVTSRRGRAVAPARITDAIRPDTVFMPFHWAGPGRANTLTNPALDPTSKMPEFKVCAVRVEAARPDAERTKAERTPGAGRPEARRTTPTPTGAAARGKAARGKAGRVEADNTTPAAAESAEPARAERSEAAGTASAEARRTEAERTPGAERPEARRTTPTPTGAAARAEPGRAEAGAGRSGDGTDAASAQAEAPAPAAPGAAA